MVAPFQPLWPDILCAHPCFLSPVWGHLQSHQTHRTFRYLWKGIEHMLECIDTKNMFISIPKVWINVWYSCLCQKNVCIDTKNPFVHYFASKRSWFPINKSVIWVRSIYTGKFDHMWKIYTQHCNVKKMLGARVIFLSLLSWIPWIPKHCLAQTLNNWLRIMPLIQLWKFSNLNYYW